MYTNGFVCVASDVAAVGTLFTGTINGISQNIVAAYISASGAGDIVWKNQYGDLNWLPGAVAGMLYVVGAVQIVASGTVNGVSRATTATGFTWFATNAQSKF